MSFLVQIILPYLLLYRYWAVFVITLVASMAFPIPPGTLLMASSAFASQGYFSFPLVVLVGTAGNILGDNIGYFISRRWGKKLLCRIKFFRSLFDSEKYKRLERRIKERPGLLLFLSRFEVVSNLSVNIIAGLSEVPYPKYVLITGIGELAQVGLYCTIGYVVGDNWQAIASVISHFLLIIVLILALVVVVFWKRIWRWLTK